MGKLDDIIAYYELEYIDHLFLNVTGDTLERLKSKLQKVSDAGCNVFAKMELITDSSDDYLYDYAESEFQSSMEYADEDDLSLTLGTPEGLLSVADAKDKEIIIGEDWEYEYDTCTAYFDRSFGNYLPDYQTHVMKMTVYMDLSDIDGLFLEVEEFEKMLDDILSELG